MDVHDRTREDIPKIAVLGGLYPLVDAWDSNDDWTGVTSTAERKKRQNRLNQRAYRRRKNAHHPTPQSLLDGTLSGRTLIAVPTSDLQKAFRPPSPSSTTNGFPPYNGHLLLSNPNKAIRARQHFISAYTSYTLHLPQPTHLPQLIRVNALNALFRNAVLMGFAPQGLCRDEFVSPFNEYGPRLPHMPLPLSDCPTALVPTALQKRLLHHPWIDLYPFPKFRENVLVGAESGVFDEDELCAELLHVEDEEMRGSEERPALIVWGDSSDWRGWEANVSFLKKWGWLAKGCPEMIQGTNYWREKRGEKPIIWEVE